MNCMVSGGPVNSKTYPTIGACGIDCGLCPRYQSTAASRCPGCAPEGFLDAGGQWCKMTRCAVRERGYETCAECAQFPCYRFEGWDLGDSFVSHLRSIASLHAIRERGIEGFAAQQQARMALLRKMLEEFDEGRSKSYCCVACALLPLDEIEEGLAQARREVQDAGFAVEDRRNRATVLHRTFDDAAERLGVSLRLRTRKKTSTGSPDRDPPSTK